MTVSRIPDTEDKIYPDTLEQQLEALETDEALQWITSQRESRADDQYRPLYHFSSSDARMNDTVGLCQWQGRYHLFWVHYPGGDARTYWGHTVSDDLVHWRDLPPAFYPTNEERCSSGQTLVDPDRVIAFYRAKFVGEAVATASDPLLLNWDKHPNNPVIPGTPDPAVPGSDPVAGEPGAEYRLADSCIWKEEDGYYAISGTYKDGRIRLDCVGVVHLFRSKDLAEWEYLGPMLEDGFMSEPGEDAAVPNFWPIGNGKHMMLLFSHKRAGRYYVGDYDRSTHRFKPDYHGRINYGPINNAGLHAPSATIDDAGRYLGIFNTKPGREQGNTHSDELVTLARRYWLDGQNALQMEPVGDIESLRFDHRRVGPIEIPANGEVPLEGVHGKAMEIEAVIDRGDAREVGVCVLRSPDGTEQTRISLLWHERTGPIQVGLSQPRVSQSSLQVDISAASLRSDVFARPAEVGPFDLADGEPLRLRVFIDRSVVEVFANDRQCLTIRPYPDREDSNGVSVFARGGSAKLVSLDAWQMRSIWPELKLREGR